MHIAVHPYLTGMPYRIDALDAALKYICKHKKVWKATGSEIARHYRAQLRGGTPKEKKSLQEEIAGAIERFDHAVPRPAVVDWAAWNVHGE